MPATTLALTVETHAIPGREGEIRVRDYLPGSPDPKAIPLLWVHGGGFSSGGLDQKESDAPARLLAAHGRHVRTIDYRLVPRRGNPFTEPAQIPHPNQYPAALHDVVDTVIDLGNQTGSAVAVGGASAGACLAAAAILYLRDNGLQLPATAAFAYGTFHATLPPDRAAETQLRGIARFVFRPAMVRQMNLNYVRDASLLVPGYAFPEGADLSRFPPTLILDAHNDRLRASGTAFARELTDAAALVKQTVVPAAKHAFLNSPDSKAFTRGVSALEDWLREHEPPAPSDPALADKPKDEET